MSQLLEVCVLGAKTQVLLLFVCICYVLYVCFLYIQPLIFKIKKTLRLFLLTWFSSPPAVEC